MPFSFDTTYKELDSVLYSRVTPKSIAHPEIVVRNDELCADLGLDTAKLDAKMLAGQDRLEEPIAQAYAGHQYGSFTILGDGRAMILGEHVYDGSRYDIALLNARQRRGGVADRRPHGAEDGFSLSEDAVAVTHSGC
jgi:uncharacterized protein YdiU (UPF0061 family)